MCDTAEKGVEEVTVAAVTRVATFLFPLELRYTDEYADVSATLNPLNNATIGNDTSNRIICIYSSRLLTLFPTQEVYQIYIYSLGY